MAPHLSADNSKVPTEVNKVQKSRSFKRIRTQFFKSRLALNLPTNYALLGDHIRRNHPNLLNKYEASIKSHQKRDAINAQNPNLENEYAKRLEGASNLLKKAEVAEKRASEIWGEFETQMKLRGKRLSETEKSLRERELMCKRVEARITKWELDLKLQEEALEASKKSLQKRKQDYILEEVAHRMEQHHGNVC